MLVAQRSRYGDANHGQNAHETSPVIPPIPSTAERPATRDTSKNAEDDGDGEEGPQNSFVCINLASN